MGHPCLFRQDFAPGQNTSSTRQRRVDSLVRSATESFSISPDGNWIAVADVFYSQSLMLAEGLIGVSPKR